MPGAMASWWHECYSREDGEVVAIFLMDISAITNKFRNFRPWYTWNVQISTHVFYKSNLMALCPVCF